VVEQIADLFHTTHKVKTRQVTRSRGQQCRDIELTGYLANEVGPVPLVLDLHIVHERFGYCSDPSINGHLHYPNDVDRSLNETVVDKIRKYHGDYNNNPTNSISFMPAIASTSGRLHREFVRFYSYKFIRKLTVFCSFRSSTFATYQWSVPLASRGILRPA
jgi:hypothetical protein